MWTAYSPVDLDDEQAEIGMIASGSSSGIGVAASAVKQQIVTFARGL